VLEKSFPRMAEEAIPGIAIPLCRAGCDCTEVDLEWLQEFIRLRSDAPWFGRPDLDGLREDVNAWFEPKALQTALGAPWTRTEDLALDWLAKGGKRWRPVLTVAACRALDRSGQKDSATAHKLALSAECFHKASLIHDDIEDEDEERYGEPTLHRRYGTAMALNVGDYLLGEGYRLVAESGAPADRVVRMLAAAAEGHRTLCLGQGQELNWRLSPVPLRSEEILEIFRRKTAPAFDVALQFGAIAAGADPETCAALHEFSQALGVGYQIRDDLDDLSGPDNDLARHRLSLLPALACEHAPEGRREAVAAAWTGGDAAALRQAVVELGIPDRARTLLANQRQLAIRALQPLRSPMLKSLLRRVLSRILGKS
jgi:geranylgeranyl pyrophosphate synthase